MVTQGPFVPSYLEIWQVDFEKKIYIKFFPLVAMATKILHGMEFIEYFWKGTAQGPFLWSLVTIYQVV